MTMSRNQAVFVMVLVAFLWSTAGVVTRQLEQAQAFELSFWRSFFSFASLLVLLPLWQGWGVWRRMRAEGWMLWVSGLCWAVMFTAFMVAIAITSVANVLLTLAAGPLLTALLSRVAIGHRLAPRTWTAIALGGIGIAWMFAQGASGTNLHGMLIAFCVPVAGAVNWTLVQRSQAHGRQVDLVPAVLIGGFLSALFTLPLAYPFQASGHDIAWLAGLGLGQLTIPCVLAVLCARVLSAPEVSLLALLEVLFGITLAWIWANEPPQPSVIQGGLLVLLAVLGNELLGWRERAGHFRIHSLQALDEPPDLKE